MRTAVLIAVLGAMGLSAFLWSGTAEAQVRPPQKANPCAELRLEIEAGNLGPVASWPQERILLGLFCAYEGDPGPTHLVPLAQVPAAHIALVNLETQDQKPPGD